MSTNIPEVSIDIPRDGDPRVGLLDPFLTKRREKQPSIFAAFKNLKICKERIGRAASRWFFFNSMSANAVKGPYYESMIETIGEVGKGVEGPTSYEIYNKYLDLEVEDMKAYVSTFERIWDEYGYTLMCDGWTGHFFNPQYMYWTNGRNENYDKASKVLIGAKNVIKRILHNEDRAIIACKQMHDYRLQLYHFGTSMAQRAAQILSPADWWLDHGRAYRYEDLAYVAIRVLSQTTSTTECERNWSTFGLIHTKQRNRLKSTRLEKLVFCELDDVSLLPGFETPPAPKRQKKVVGARVRSKQRGISIADLETIEEDNDDETSEPSDNLVYQTSNDSSSKTSTPSEGSDHGGDVSSVPPPAPPPDLLYSLERKTSPMLLKMSTMGVSKGGKHNKPQVNIMNGRGRKWHLNSKGKAKAKFEIQSQLHSA
ncbi:hypothetical protein Taro_032769 [Colocasia esculenta]|uniref:HAT C-terminal dimerisation domain-containing protein n=1 Tax=Colocasia esculenta TaxID=4460 RepID=A0A843W737_COLES|nr:hypothetical protein [Colocasia esculenta]